MTDRPSTEKGGVSMASSSRPIFMRTDDAAVMKSLESKIDKLGKRSKEEKFDPKKHKDTKRAQIAMVFVWGYIALVAIIIVGAPLFNAILAGSKEPIDIERVLSQVGSLIGAPLGFVIGYYFKEDK